MTDTAVSGRDGGRGGDCPACLEGTGVPIVFGYPSGEVFDDADAGRIVLGGCVIGGNPDRPDDNRECDRCGHRWYVSPGSKTVPLSTAQATIVFEVGAANSDDPPPG